MTSIPISAQESYILNVKQQRKLYVWLTKKTSTAPRKNFKLNLLRRTDMSQIWKVKLNQLCHYFCEVKIWIYIDVTQIVSQSPFLCVLPHQHWYWFTDKSKWHMCTCDHLEWLLTLAIWSRSFKNKTKNLECTCYFNSAFISIAGKKWFWNSMYQKIVQMINFSQNVLRTSYKILFTTKTGDTYMSYQPYLEKIISK